MTRNYICNTIKITNDGYGPVSNVIMTDILLLDRFVHFDVISLTKGHIFQEENQIIWDIGTLNADSAIVIVAEITGFFLGKDF